MKAFRVDFSFEDRAYLHIVADNPEAANAGALQMLNTVKNPVITSVTEVEKEDEGEQLELFPVDPTTLQ